MGAVLAAARAGEELNLGIDAEEELFLWKTFREVVAYSGVHAMVTTETLMQLGHEPFPLSIGKSFIERGRDAYFMPNAFSYAKQLAEMHGWSVLMTGFDSGALALIAARYTTRWTTKYLDKHYPEMGGKAEHEGEDERVLTDGQSFRRMLRAAILKSTMRTVAVFASRPFTVVCIRQIAQLIGGESKYLNPAQAMQLIITEEGLSGLFSGVFPQLCAELLSIWTSHVISFVAERALTRSGIDQGEDKENDEKNYKRARRVIRFFAPLTRNFLPTHIDRQKYSVVSTVMACVGSGLTISFLPHNATFNNWQDCYDFLGPHGLQRGARLFYREVGFVGMNENLEYALRLLHDAYNIFT